MGFPTASATPRPPHLTHHHPPPPPPPPAGLYGVYVVRRADLIVCNAVATAFWFSNFAVVWWFTPGRGARAALAAGYAAAVAFSILIYVVLWEVLPADAVPARATIVAAIMQVFNVSGFASPFRAIAVAVRELDTRRVPASLSYLNVVNSSLWTGYGVALGDGWIYVPNALGVGLAAAQLGVLAYIARERRRRGAAVASAPAEPAAGGDGGGGAGGDTKPVGAEATAAASAAPAAAAAAAAATATAAATAAAPSSASAGAAGEPGDTPPPAPPV